MSFWIISFLFIILIAGMMALALFRQRDLSIKSGAEFDLEVYQDQLKAVETDLERNVISPQEAARVKTEISRRILDADKALSTEKLAQRAPKSATYAAIVGVFAVLGGSAWVYNTIGAPGYPDLPLKARYEMAKDVRDNRQSQAEAEKNLPPAPPLSDPKMIDLVEKLRNAVSTRPTDLTGHQYLARYEAAIGQYKNAYTAMITVIELKKQDAEANDFALLADLMAMAAGGYISPEAETVLQRALDKDPENGIALYLTGKMFSQTGRPDVTFEIWRGLLERSTPQDPWYDAIRGQIEMAAQMAGVQYALPEPQTGPALAGPSAADIAAAGDMSSEDQQSFVNSMVARLTDRLTSDGGSPKEWAQLINALGVQGNSAQAVEIVGLARKSYENDTAALATINAAAKRAGVAD